MENTNVTVDKTFSGADMFHGMYKSLGNKGLALHYEQAVFSAADFITRNGYNGGMWEFVVLSNGGFLMTFPHDETFTCYNASNGAEHELSAEAFSVVVNVFVSSTLSFEYQGQLDQCAVLSDNYHLLRDYFLQDDENPFDSETIQAMLAILD